MNIVNVLSMLGGVAIFLFGMKTMAGGLEKLSGGRLEAILEKMTSNIFKSIFFGAVVAGLIHSSGATTVMVVGFVNSGIMNLSQTVGIIMGANIGTTVTSQILRLADISGDASVWADLMKPIALGSLLAVCGIVLNMFTKSGKKQIIGQALLGLGILFIGMSIMSEAVYPLRESEKFKEILSGLSNPILGVLMGAVITAILQSSTASIGILQALTTTGVISFSIAAPIVFGQNIGTCVVALMSAIGASTNAKRTAMIHFYFNLIGTVFFLTLLYTIHQFVDLSFWNSTMNYGSIANLHLFFNLGCTLLFIPFNKFLVFLAEKTIPDKGGEVMDISKLDERFLSTPAVALDKTKETVVSMGYYALSNFSTTIELFDMYDEKKMDRLTEIENAIDKMEVKVENYLVLLTRRELTQHENSLVSELLHTVGDFERIGDYAINLTEAIQYMRETGITFSDEALKELHVLGSACEEIIGMTVECYETNNRKLARRIEPLEQVIDVLVEMLRSAHIDRLKDGTCNIDAGTLFLDQLTNFERISDHASNVAVYVIRNRKIRKGEKQFDAHEYRRMTHQGITEEYNEAFDEYKKKYIEHL